jgi:hypothetical protein
MAEVPKDPTRDLYLYTLGIVLGTELFCVEQYTEHERTEISTLPLSHYNNIFLFLCTFCATSLMTACVHPKHLATINKTIFYITKLSQTDVP